MYSVIIPTIGMLSCVATWKDKFPVSYLLGLCSNYEATRGEAGHGCYHQLLEVTSPGPKSAHPTKTSRWSPPNPVPAALNTKPCQIT